MNGAHGYGSVYSIDLGSDEIVLCFGKLLFIRCKQAGSVPGDKIDYKLHEEKEEIVEDSETSEDDSVIAD